jgi:hypothetical protein
MQKSAKIAWTIVALLVSGIVVYKLDTATAIGKVGYLIGLLTIVVIAAIWRQQTVKK